MFGANRKFLLLRNRNINSKNMYFGSTISGISKINYNNLLLNNKVLPLYVLYNIYGQKYILSFKINSFRLKYYITLGIYFQIKYNLNTPLIYTIESSVVTRKFNCVAISFEIVYFGLNMVLQVFRQESRSVNFDKGNETVSSKSADRKQCRFVVSILNFFLFQ